MIRISDKRSQGDDTITCNYRHYPVAGKWPKMAAVGLCAGIFLYQPVQVLGASPDNPEQVALGEKVYQENCASCHGDKLEGQPNWRVRKPDGKLPAPPHDETGHTWHHPDEQIFQVIKLGTEALVPGDYKSDMQAFEDVITDDEILAVISFIKTFWTQEARDLNNRMNEANEQ